MSYSIPKGVQRGLEIDLSDQTYDGHDENDRLVDGLGQLVDGQRGTDNFRNDIHGYGKGMFNTHIPEIQYPAFNPCTSYRFYPMGKLPHSQRAYDK